MSENVPPTPSAMSESGDAPTPTRKQPTRKSKKSTAKSILSPRPNGYTESTDSPHFSSGLLSPPMTTKKPTMDASSTLISPPPEETLQRQGRTPVSDSAEPSLAASKRKRPAPSPEASTSSLPNDAGQIAAPPTPNPRLRKQLRRSDVDEAPESPTNSSFSIHVSPPSASRPRRSVSPSNARLLLSPHNTNPNADFIPPSPTHSRNVISAKNRRSITPMPPYEPPQERFTPPREVMGSPIGAKGNKRKPAAKRPGKQLKLVIKEEPPELDLSQPAPPASPTEDPLLLAGPSERSGAKPRLARSPATPEVVALPPTNTSSPWEGSPLSITLAPRSEVTPQAAPALGATSSPWDGSQMSTTIGYVGNDTSDTSMDAQPREDDIIFPMGEWSDSEDGAEAYDQSGEYTGNFTTVRVPTKADPPTSVTKERQDAWGRPVSPFPYPSRRTSRWSSPAEPSSPSAPGGHDLPGLDDDNLDQMNLDTTPERSAHEEQLQSNPAPHAALLEASSPFNMALGSQVSASFAQTRLITSAVPSMFNFADISSTPAAPVPRFSTIHRAIPDRDTEMSDDQTSPTAVMKPGAEMNYQRQQSVTEEEEEEEEEQFIDRELSHGLFDEAPKYSFPLPETPTPAWDTSMRQRAPQASASFSQASSAEDIPDDSEGSEEDDGELDLGIIKITSEDPMAAARAAAILKLHDYDCLPKIPVKRTRSHSTVGSLVRDSFRRSVSAAGITKGTPRRRKSAGVVGDRVFMPGSPSRTLPELLKEAEVDLGRSGSVNSRFSTPVRTRQFPHVTPQFVRDSSIESAVIEPRAWSKSDWKLLDSCFTDERLDVAERQGLPEGELADTSDVDMSDVVERFVEAIGGDSALAILGDSWTRVDILRRTRALEKKQQAGKGAPGSPSRGRTPASDTSTQIEVPDFTPSAMRFNHEVLQPTDVLPAPLLARRYSHLMDEAVSISKGKDRAQSPGLFKRLTTPIISYLPGLRQMPPEQRKPTDQHGLPLPPPEMFERERDPIVTPAGKPAPRSAHPKDIVQLQPAPLPKPSMIPRAVKPQRMVDLRHAPLPESPPLRKVPDGRRGSGGSVKDLVKNFERLDESMESVGLSRSTRSINDWMLDAPGAKTKTGDKPKWK